MSQVKFANALNLIRLVYLHIALFTEMEWEREHCCWTDIMFYLYSGNENLRTNLEVLWFMHIILMIAAEDLLQSTAMCNVTCGSPSWQLHTTHTVVPVAEKIQLQGCEEFKIILLFTYCNCNMGFGSALLHCTRVFYCKRDIFKQILDFSNLTFSRLQIFVHLSIQGV